MSTKSQQDQNKSKRIDLLKSLTNSTPEELMGDTLNHAMLESKAESEEGFPGVEEWLAMPEVEKLNVLHDSLLELYLNVKIRNFDNTISSEKVDEELEKLKNVETITLVDYIKSCVEIVISMKAEEDEEKVKEAVKEKMRDMHNEGEYDLSQSPEEYEKIIQKLEAEVRNHISVQQQMKLYIESYQSKVEELEPLEEKSLKFEEKLGSLQRNIQKLNKANDELNKDKAALRKRLEEKESSFTSRIDNLNSKIKELQSKLDLRSARETNHGSSLSRQDSKHKYFHQKNEMSVDIPESQKSLYYSFFENSKQNNAIVSKKSKDSNKENILKSPNKIFLPCKGWQKCESRKCGNKPLKITSNRKNRPYKVDYYHYTGDNYDKKKGYRHNSVEKHKRSKSQTINSVKGRKGNSNSVNETSMQEMSYLLQQHLQNTKTSYNLVNEYLENPGKNSNITVVKNTTTNGGKAGNRSRGKRIQSTNNGIYKKTSGNKTGVLKNGFKSFDKRRACTNLERREGSLEDPLSFLRSSSACHKYSYDKQSTGKKSNRGSKTNTSKRVTKIRNSSNAGNYSKIATKNAVCRFMKT